MRVFSGSGHVNTPEGPMRSIGWSRCWRACAPILNSEKRAVAFLSALEGFLHFHEDPAGQFADIRAPGGTDFDRLPLNEASERRTLLERVARALA